ncbi:MAG: DNA polymerase III subunit delta' [Candidatus Aminicenantes bacterium]
MAFSDIVGNERQKNILRKALQKERIPNSMLFCGSEGVGKDSVALVLAKAMNCEKKKDDACEACSSCKAINRSQFPDVMVISPEREVVKIDQMRTLKQTAYLRPMAGRKRVFIVNEAEKMNEEAANSLLKILEEPPFFSHIILITHNSGLIKPTIRSRCQKLNFQPVSREDIQKVLVEKGWKKEKANTISLLVGGNLKRALSLEWEEVQGKREQAWELFLSFLHQEKRASYLHEYVSSPNFIREELEEILEILSSFYRDFILVKEKGDTRLLMNPDYAPQFMKAQKILSLGRTMDCLEEIDYALFGLHKNLNVNLLASSFFSNLTE